MWKKVDVLPERQGQYPCAVVFSGGGLTLEYRMYFLNGGWWFDVSDDSPYLPPLSVDMKVVAWFDIPNYTGD